MSVLIVDDDPSFRETARLLLRARGFGVAGEASDSAEALGAVRDLRPDGVLLDVHLPGVDGLQVAREIASIASGAGGPRVLLTSSDGAAASDDVAARVGAVGFVPKTELVGADLARYFSGGESG